MIIFFSSMHTGIGGDFFLHPFSSFLMRFYRAHGVKLDVITAVAVLSLVLSTECDAAPPRAFFVLTCKWSHGSEQINKFQ